MVKISPVYECTACGARFSKAMGKCGACGDFNSIQEVKGKLRKDTCLTRSAFANSDYQEPISLADIAIGNNDRRTTGLSELDRVLGGGVVPGMVILLGGEPGIGKSTLVLQWAAAFCGNVLYASGEESERQIKLRAERLGADNTEISVFAETDVRRILEVADKTKPALLLIDSIQTLFDPEFESSAGSVSQVRGCATLLARWAKNTGTPLILVGHVTKDGTLAGPKVLEHLVDTVLAFEGDRHHNHRLLRALKNRFGAAFELGVFTMTERGLTPVDGNPFFLEVEPSPGCAATVVISGTRPIVVEIQALVASTSMGIPRRTALGIDGQRLAMLCAVVERRGGIHLHDRDIYVNVAGGLEIEDPAVDLAIVAALVSSSLGYLLMPKTLFLGEVGLTGEVRPVAQLPLRLQEGSRLGFVHAVVPSMGLDRKTPPLKLISENNMSQLRSRPWLLRDT
jgi:DNA repair protein RadA/Sms